MDIYCFIKSNHCETRGLNIVHLFYNKTFNNLKVYFNKVKVYNEDRRKLSDVDKMKLKDL